MLLLCASTEVQAGYWEVVPNMNYYPNGDNPTFGLWPQLRKGVTEDEVTKGLAPNEQIVQAFRSRLWEYNSSYGFGWNPGYDSTYTSAATSGGLSFQRVSGTAKTLLRWKPSGPNDKAPMFLGLFIEAYAQGSASTNLPSSSVGGFAGYVHANAALSLEATNGALIDWSAVVSEPEHKEMPTNGTQQVAASASQKGTYFRLIQINGLEQVWVPTATLTGYGKADPDRKSMMPSGSTYYSQPLDGSATASTYYRGLPVATTLTPNPEGLALMNCADPTKPVTNQCVIYDNGITLLPCGVAFSPLAADPSLRAYLSNGFSWQIEPKPWAPMTMRPTLGNVVDDPWGQSPNIHVISAPMPTPTPNGIGGGATGPEPTPLPGLAFDTSQGLPASNDGFGLTVVHHQFNNNDIATAPIALFYNATGTGHPAGGPPGYTHDSYLDVAVDTPNWIYYYDKAWTPPCPVWYSPKASNIYGYYTESDPFIRLCNAYKPWPTFVYRKSYDQLARVGTETVKGIDTYARILAHEYAHMKCYDAIHASWLVRLDDTDEDGVPDAWEKKVGLIVGVKNTTGFSMPGAYDNSDGDSEAFARLHEEGVFGPPGGDWAVDGLNWGTAAPNFCDDQRTVKRDLNDNPVTSFPGSPEEHPAGGTS